MDILEIRSQTPGCDKVVHLNNAGASLVSESVLNGQLDYLKEESLLGGYETAAKRDQQLESLYKELAALLNAESEEIAFTESATVAWLRAFYSIDFKAGDEIICDTTSYASNYIAFLNAKDHFNLKIVKLKQDEYGAVDVDHLKKVINSKTKLVSITHMPTNNGLVNPAEEIGSVAAKQDVFYQLDACQSAGQYPIDVKKINCDFLSATGRKYMRGPRGTGFLFVKKSVLKRLTPLNLDLHSAEWVSENEFMQRKDARKYETWETNLAAKWGLAIATKNINTLGITKIWKRVTELSEYLRNQVSQLDHITVRDYGKVKSGIVTLTSQKLAPQNLKAKLAEAGINTTVAIKSGTLLDMDKRNLDSVLRASVHYYNTKEEIDTFVHCIK